jgi:hypothetical protein
MCCISVPACVIHSIFSPSVFLQVPYFHFEALSKALPVFIFIKTDRQLHVAVTGGSNLMHFDGKILQKVAA